MKRFWKWILGAVVLLVIALQFVNPVRLTPAAGGHDLLAPENPARPPEEIATLLRNACYDCHSDNTEWPWYGHVAPVSWWMTSHVNDARRRLNFSDWPANDSNRAAKKWNSIADAVESGDMPLPSYARIHRAARLTSAQRQQLVNWASGEAKRLHTIQAE